MNGPDYTAFWSAPAERSGDGAFPPGSATKGKAKAPSPLRSAGAFHSDSGSLSISFCVLCVLLRLDCGGEPDSERLRGSVSRAAAARAGATAGARRAVAGPEGAKLERERWHFPGRRPGASL